MYSWEHHSRNLHLERSFVNRAQSGKAMKTTILQLIILGSLSLALPVAADVLELKNGTVLKGNYVGGTQSTVHFDSGSGAQAIQKSQVISLTFTVPAPPGKAAPARTPAASSSSQTVTLPAGTTLMVRMMDSVSSKNKAGTPFTTKLEYDLGGLKGGATVYGRIQSSTDAGRVMGQSTLDLRLSQIVVNGQSIPIATSGFQEAAQKSGVKVAKGAAAGAAIGALAGAPGKGAANGAVVGGVIHGKSITVPPGTLLEFTLLQPVTVPAA